MAALRPMMAVAREEAAIITSETAAAARTSVATEAATTARAAGREVLNPLAVREAAEGAAQRALSGGESSLLNGLTHARGDTATLSTTSTATNTVLTELGIESTTTTTATAAESASTVVAQTFESEFGVTLKETLANAGETGVQDLTMQAAEAGQMVLERPNMLNQQVAAAGMRVPELASQEEQQQAAAP